MEPERSTVESWKNNPWQKLPPWAKWVIGVVGTLLLLGAGGAIASSDNGDLEKEVSALEDQLAESKDRQASAEESAEQIESQQSRILGEARRKAARIRGNAVGETNQETDKLAALKSEASSVEAELEDLESSLGNAEHEAALSTMGDGTWKAEVDYIPGTYRAPGGTNCYWATLNSADPYDIASNENGTGQQIATIETPYFQTDGCGTWERIE
jgi:hypothetical protein